MRVTNFLAGFRLGVLAAVTLALLVTLVFPKHVANLRLLNTRMPAAEQSRVLQFLSQFVECK